jgi:hypothetical protein
MAELLGNGYRSKTGGIKMNAITFDGVFKNGSISVPKRFWNDLAAKVKVFLIPENDGQNKESPAAIPEKDDAAADYPIDTRSWFDEKGNFKPIPFSPEEQAEEEEFDKNYDSKLALKSFDEFCKAVDAIKDEPLPDDFYLINGKGLNFKKVDEI